MEDIGKYEGGRTTACFALFSECYYWEKVEVEVVVAVDIRTSLTHYDRVNLVMLHWSSHRVGVTREKKT